MTDTKPAITCLCVTRKRVPLLRRAVDGFLNQTYAAKKLLIVYDADDAETHSYLGEIAGTPGIVGWQNPAQQRLPLGALRNLSVQMAATPLVAQWDDDDFHSPRRLEVMVEHLLASGLAACVLSRWTMFDGRTGKGYVSGQRPWEGSVVAWKERLPPYPDLKRGEDTVMIRDLITSGQLAHLDRPDLYIYTCHGANTWEGDHWDKILLPKAKLLTTAESVKIRSLLELRLPESTSRAVKTQPQEANPMKVAVITPYYKEDFATLMRCRDSVKKQTYGNIQHYFVADGYPNWQLAAMGDISHMTLPESHKDYGNTPRCLGSISALNQGADIICYLDADNYYAPEHVQSVVAKFLERASTKVVCSWRYMYPIGHPDKLVRSQEDENKTHVDTSGISISKKGAFLIPYWAMMPKFLGAICDRVMFSIFKTHNVEIAWTEQRTVYYESNYSGIFDDLKLSRPEIVHDVDMKKIKREFDAQAFYERTHLQMNFNF